MEVVADVVHSGGHPRGADDRVVLGPDADVTGEPHRVQVGVGHQSEP